MNEEPAPYLRFEDVLTEASVAELIEFVTTNEQDLRPSGVQPATSGERPEALRRSRTLFNSEPIWPLFETQLTNLLPIIRKELGVSHFPLDHIERQLTVHFDGDFFGPHNDSGSPEVASRRITYVYYFNRDPKQFDGGDLRLYHSVDQRGAKHRGADYVTIEPIPNSIIFFPSWVHHEVLRVRTLANGLDGARMTFNGWFHAAKASEQFDLETRTEVQRTQLPTFTSQGFEVRATPKAVTNALMAAYEQGRGQSIAEAPDHAVLPTGEPDLISIGSLGDWVAEELRHIHEQWSGQTLSHTATYGIRSYRAGQTLSRHCDRPQTHVVSSVVHIDHDGEPWPLVIEDHKGQPHEVVLAPGQMVLYESATCPHSRPRPFTGTHYASVFVHYRPTSGWDIDEESLFARGHLISPTQ